MLKKTIKYTDFNGDEQERDFYFNLSKAELTEMQIAQRGGMEKYLQNVIEQQDPRKLLDVLKSFIEAAYGVRSEDGTSFIKSQDHWLRFKGSGAYDVLFMEMVGSETFMVEFVRGIIPADLREDAAQQVAQADISVEEKFRRFKEQGMSDAEARSRAEASRSHLPPQQPNNNPVTAEPAQQTIGQEAGWTPPPASPIQSVPSVPQQVQQQEPPAHIRIQEPEVARPMTPDEMEKNGLPRDFHQQ